ncbi:MAG: sodium:calcium antiporter [Acidimicrobiales bacterium]|nr:sodium:calcium antiporter [Acidimicrobiales bacterium]
MAQNVILLVVAMVGLTLFADRFVAGAAQLAARLNVSTVVAGALIIGFGTSAPELVVSTVATLTEGAEGTALGIGNIVGANVANLTLVLSVPALVFGGIAIQKGVKRQAALSATGVTIFALAAYAGQPTVVKGVGMALLMVVALRIVVRLGEGVDDGVTSDGAGGPGAWVWTLVGLVGTVGFAHLVVRGATGIADEMGWTGGFVGFALVALGTTQPELLTALAAARRGESGLVFGNLLGSNLFNSLTVGSAVFLANGNKPYDEASRLPVGSLLIMVAVSWLVIVMMATGRRIRRGEAIVLLGVYGAVLGWLAMTGATA